MRQAEGVADLMQCHAKPSPAVLAVTPVVGGVHDGHEPFGSQAGGIRVDGGVESPHVTRDDGDALIGSLDKANAGIAAVDLKDFPCTLLLRLGNGVEERVALRIGAVHALEVVRLLDNVGGGTNSWHSVAVLLDGEQCHIAMPGLSDRAHLGWIRQEPDGRGNEGPHVDLA